jgi:hypothetical protein
MGLLYFLKRYGISSVIGILLVTLSIVYFQLKQTRSERDVAIAQRDVARTQLTALSAQVGLQNAAIKEWEDEGNAQSARLEVAMQEAESYEHQYHDNAQTVLSQSVPTDCLSAISWAARMGKQLTINH